MSHFSECFVCGQPAKVDSNSTMNYFVTCDRCGNYLITENAVLDGRLSQTPVHRRRDAYILSGVLRRASEQKKMIEVTTKNLESLIEEANQPDNPLDSIDAFLWLIYHRIKSMDDAVVFKPATDYSLLFARSPEEFVFVALKAGELGLVKSAQIESATILRAQLEIPGWRRIIELRDRNPPPSRMAFMAMPFGNDNLDRLYKDHIKVAVEQTGFQIKRVDEKQPAGLIDDQLRVDIRNCRFLIAELTDNNNGAYWEAGYAEGMGKPVIYLCKKDVQETVKTHFDTNHHTTVFWNDENISQAMNQLRATIRATLPGEAQLHDTIA